MKKYKIIGYGMPKGKTEWQMFNDNTILQVDNDFYPYSVLHFQLSNIMDYWLAYLEEIKEENQK